MSRRFTLAAIFLLLTAAALIPVLKLHAFLRDNAPPTAVDDSYLLNEDTLFNLPAAGILSNDDDPDRDPLSAVMLLPPINGTAVLSPNGALSFTPDTNFNGAVTFTYLISDGHQIYNFQNSGMPLETAASRRPTLIDLDNDGDLDLFVPNEGPNSVWFNDGSGLLTDSGQTLGNYFSFSAAFADLDHDNDLDAFVANWTGHPNTVWWNDGFGYFSDSGQRLGNSNTFVAALGDLDGDGDLDAFSANYSGHPDRIWINSGNGIFTATIPLPVNQWSSDVALADFDLDNDLDALVANTFGAGNILWQNDGNSNFTAVQTMGTGWTMALELGDLDNDGDLDVATVNDLGQPNRVWLNQGGLQAGTAGNFVAGSFWGNVSNSKDVAIADFDKDGDLDLVSADNGPNAVWLNAGGIQSGTLGLFINSGQTLGNETSYGIAVGDINQNGRADIFVSNYAGQMNELWWNQRTIFTATAVVTLTVTAVNDAPIAAADTFTMSWGSVYTAPAGSLLSNDLDVDGDPLLVQLFTPPAFGTLQLSSDGALIYTSTLPADIDQFSYTLYDGMAASAPVTVTLQLERTTIYLPFLSR